VELKEVVKWLLPDTLQSMLEAQHSTRSKVMLELNWDHPLGLAEAAFVAKFDQQLRARRTRHNKGGKRRRGEAVVPAQAIARQLPEISRSDFCQASTVPPAVLEQRCTLVVGCSREPIYLTGRYCKYDRNTPQSCWIIDGQRKGVGSVDEWVCDPICGLFGAKEHKFLAAGREDIDVRMLGNGRPFVVELHNTQKASVEAAEIEAVAQDLNRAAEGTVEVIGLALADREACDAIKAAEESKRKSYSCVVWLSEALPQSHIDQVVANTMKDGELVLQQKTPLRVLHRRTLMVRQRSIYRMEVERVNQNFLLLRLETQAGTYIKEFVTGDLGRTRPSFGDLVGCEADILQLDVAEVHM